MDTATKTRQDALKTASRKVVHKAAEATGEFIKKKFDKIVKPEIFLTVLFFFNI